MKTKLVLNKVVVKKSPIHGYGVFAEKNLEPNEIIEECHTLLSDTFKDEFSRYYFAAADEKNALPLGFGCIYNHSDQPNATYQYDPELQLMIFKAVRFIHRGEEIFTSYGKNWFDGRKLQKKEIPMWRKVWRYFAGMPLRAIMVSVSVILLAQLIVFIFR